MRGPPSSPARPAEARHGELNTTEKTARRSTPLLPRGVLGWLMLKLVGVALFCGHLQSWGLLFYFGPDPWLLYQIVIPSGRGFGPTFSRFRTDQKEVWLTIDDGPDAVTTPAILALLDRHQARATFFVIGQQVDRLPELTAEILKHGHELGNHTQTHPANHLWRYSPRQTRVELQECQTAVERATQQVPVRARVPVGVKNIFLHRALGELNLDLIAWSARGFDSICSPDTAVPRIIRGIGPGAIVLVHEGRGRLQNVAVLARVLDHLAEKGYRCVIPPREILF